MPDLKFHLKNNGWNFFKKMAQICLPEVELLVELIKRKNIKDFLRKSIFFLVKIPSLLPL